MKKQIQLYVIKSFFSLFLSAKNVVSSITVANALDNTSTEASVLIILKDPKSVLPIPSGDVEKQRFSLRGLTYGHQVQTLVLSSKQEGSVFHFSSLLVRPSWGIVPMPSHSQIGRFTTTKCDTYLQP